MNGNSFSREDGVKEGAVSLRELVAAMDAELNSKTTPDSSGALNGLQFGNSGHVNRVAVAVDASRHAITEAEVCGADLLIVHHGLFWSGIQPVTGMTYDKYRALIRGDIAVYSSHIPLDLHPTLGNNTLLANALELTPDAGFARYQNAIEIGLQGAADEDTSVIVDRATAFSARYGGTVRTSVPVNGRRTKRWAMCSGAGASLDTVAEAVAAGVDTLIVGEGPHHTTVSALEHDLCIIYAGHYATETLGVQALGAWIEARFGLPWSFLHLPTGS